MIVGALSTFFNYGIYSILYVFTELNYSISYIMGFFSGVLFSYVLNRFWTFQVEKGHYSNDLIRYFIVYLVSLFIGLICINIMVEIFNIDPIVANIGVISITVCINFIGVKFWVFK